MTQVDMQAFLKRHDLYWSQPPKKWDDCAFLGNGMLGAMIYGAEHKSKRQTLRFVMGRVDVTARREHGFAARVPVGEFELNFGSWIYGGSKLRLDLYGASLHGELVTVQGSGQVRALVHSTRDVLLIEAAVQGDTAALEWVPYPEVSPAVLVDDGRPNIDQYLPDTRVETERLGGVQLSCQIYGNSEDGCTTAWLCLPIQTGTHRWLATIQRGHSAAVRQEAARLLLEAAAEEEESWLAVHLDWWRRYWSESFVSLPDTRLEGFYYVQMYKLACATRADGPVLDNQGPWTGATPWPGTWFNMNVQLAYSPVYTSNHLKQGESLCNSLDRNLQSLIDNVPEEWRSDSAGIGRSMSHDLAGAVGDETGNLVWALHNYYRQYRCTMNDGMLRERLYPLLRRAVNYYLHLLRPGEDGLLHLPATISPEYGSFKQLKVTDCTYDLSLLRWGLAALLQFCQRLGIADEQEPRWRETLARLPDLPVDETGFLIGKGVRMEHGHRHYSHLLGVSPLHSIDCADPENRARIMTSLRHWIGLEGDLRGFTFAGAASIAAALGEGEEALRYILAGLELFCPNTFYREAGPVIESPLGMAEAVHDLLLQSHSGTVHVFPALPAAWVDVSFADLRAEGAFLVTAVRRGGAVRFVRVTSLAGEPLRLRLEQETVGTLCARYGGAPAKEARILPRADGSYDIPLATGEAVTLFPAGCGEASGAEPTMEPVRAQRELCNYWGSFKPWRRYGIPFAD